MGQIIKRWVDHVVCYFDFFFQMCLLFSLKILVDNRGVLGEV